MVLFSTAKYLHKPLLFVLYHYFQARWTLPMHAIIDYIAVTWKNVVKKHLFGKTDFIPSSFEGFWKFELSKWN